MVKITEDDVSKYLKDAENSCFVRNWYKKQIGLTQMYAWFKQDKKLAESEVSCMLSSLSVPPLKSTYSINMQRSSIRSNMFHDMIDGRKRSNPPSRMNTMSHIENLKDAELFMELIRDISKELEVDRLCHKILINVSILTNSDRCSLFLMRGSNENRYLVSKLFDVTSHSTLEDNLHSATNQICVPLGKGIAGMVALTKEAINIKDAYQDSRFNKEVDLKTGYHTKSILCMPIINYEGEVVGVAEIMNKRDGEAIVEFTKKDEQIFSNYLDFCGIGITNAQLVEMATGKYKRNDRLLKLARGVFSMQHDLVKLVEKILTDSQELLQGERCYVYLLDELEVEGGNKSYKVAEDVIFSNIFQLIMKQEGSECSDRSKVKVKTENDIIKCKSLEIAQKVVVSNEHVYIPDTSTSSNPDVSGGWVDKCDGFKIKGILSLPIMDKNMKCIGVVQLMNPISGSVFTAMDINILESFAIFCGLGIHNSQMYNNICSMMSKQKRTLEALSYQASATVEEADKLLELELPDPEAIKLFSYDFNDLELSELEICACVLQMFLSSGLREHFKVELYMNKRFAEEGCHLRAGPGPNPEKSGRMTNLWGPRPVPTSPGRLLLRGRMVDVKKQNKMTGKPMKLVPTATLARWTMSVKKNYRPVTYHNWRHGFNVGNSMYVMMYTSNIKRLFTQLQVFALLVACISHDLDHRGTNNAFQNKIISPIAQLYSTSTMEHHHFDQCVMIINSEGNNIFANLTSAQYKEALHTINTAIIATDLAMYFKNKGKFVGLVADESTDWLQAENNTLLYSMMMTASDLAAICKPFHIQSEVAGLVSEEFFQQGDLERDVLHEEPMAMMDRKKKELLPKMQMGFMDFVCLALYKAMVEFDSGLTPLLTGIEKNRSEWKKLADIQEEKEKAAQEEEEAKQNSNEEQNKDEENTNKTDLKTGVKTDSKTEESGDKTEETGEKTDSKTEKTTIDKNNNMEEKSEISLGITGTKAELVNASSPNKKKKSKKTCFCALI